MCAPTFIVYRISHNLQASVVSKREGKGAILKRERDKDTMAWSVSLLLSGFWPIECAVVFGENRRSERWAASQAWWKVLVSSDCCLRALWVPWHHIWRREVRCGRISVQIQQRWGAACSCALFWYCSVQADCLCFCLKHLADLFGAEQTQRDPNKEEVRQSSVPVHHVLVVSGQAVHRASMGHRTDGFDKYSSNSAVSKHQIGISHGRIILKLSSRPF